MLVIDDRGWFTAINDFARATPWLHAILLAYATFGIVVFATVMLAGWWTTRARADLAVMTRADLHRPRVLRDPAHPPRRS